MLWPGLNANEIQIPYDKHHKVSSSVKKSPKHAILSNIKEYEMSNILVKYEVLNIIRQYLRSILDIIDWSRTSIWPLGECSITGGWIKSWTPRKTSKISRQELLCDFKLAFVFSMHFIQMTGQTFFKYIVISYSITFHIYDRTRKRGVNRFSDRRILPYKAHGLWIFAVNRADSRILKTQWIVDQL